MRPSGRFIGEEYDQSEVARRLSERLQQIPASDVAVTAVTLEEQATVLTRNARDFEQVADLHIENWIDE